MFSRIRVRAREDKADARQRQARLQSGVARLQLSCLTIFAALVASSAATQATAQEAESRFMAFRRAYLAAMPEITRWKQCVFVNAE